MEEFWKNLIGGGGAVAGGLLAKEGYDRLAEIGERAYGEFAGPEGLADRLSTRMEFRPYTVTTGTGGRFSVNQDGVSQLQMSPQEQAMYNKALQQASMFFDQAAMPTAQREQEVYNRMRAVMSPEEERQRLALEQRLFNQGRSGVRTSMFGGTPQELALAKAQEEARNEAMLAAMEFAGQEQDRQARLGTGMLAAGYVPQAQMISALQPGITAQEQARLNLLDQSQAYGETYAAGLEALLQSGLGQASILGGLGANIAGASLGGLFKK